MNKDLYEYAYKKGIIIERVKLPKNKSLSTRIMNRDFIGIDIKDLENSAEERTHLMHELGHCRTGAFYDMYSPLQVRGKSEYKANKWALRKFIPKQELFKLIKKGYKLYELAEHFNVTEDYIRIAYKFYFDCELQ